MSDSENEEKEKPYPKDSQVQEEVKVEKEENNEQNDENNVNNEEDNNFPEEQNDENNENGINKESINNNTFPEKEENNLDDFIEPENEDNKNNEDNKENEENKENNNEEEKIDDFNNDNNFKDDSEENNNNKEKANSFRFSNEHEPNNTSSHGPLDLNNVKDNEFEYEEDNKNENNENNNNINNNNSFGFNDSDLNNNNNNMNNNQYENDFNNKSQNENDNDNNIIKDNIRNSGNSDSIMNNNINNNKFKNNNNNINNNNNNSQIKKSNNNNFNYAKNPYLSNSNNNNINNNNNNNNFNNYYNNNNNRNNNNYNNYNNNTNPKGAFGNSNINQTQSHFIPQESPITNNLNNNNYNYSSNYPEDNNDYSSHSSDYDPLFEKYEQYPEDSDGFDFDPSKRGKDSSTTAGIQIANTIMGAGILSIPLMMSYLGILIGTLLLVFLAVCTIYSVYILMRCHQITGKSGYSMFGKITMGTVGSILVKVIIIINNMGICICYLRIFGEVFQTILQSFISKNSWIMKNWHNFIFILIGSVIMMFFIFIKNISSLKKVSYLGVIAVIIFVILLTVLLLYKTIAKELDSNISWRFLFPDCSFPEAFHATSSVFLAFLFQFNVFPIYYSLHNRGIKSMFRATKIGVILSFIIFLVIGIIGFFLYGFYYNYDDENYKEVYGTTNNNTATYDTILDKLNDDMILYKGYNIFVVILIIIICVAFIVTCLASFPILFLSMRVNYINSIEVCRRAKENNDVQSVQILQGQFQQKKQHVVMNRKLYIVITILLYLFMVAIAILVYNLRTLFMIIGAIAGTFIAFILPNIFYIRIVKMSGKNYSIILPLIILFIGVFFFVMSVIMAFF